MMRGTVDALITGRGIGGLHTLNDTLRSISHGLSQVQTTKWISVIHSIHLQCLHLRTAMNCVLKVANVFFFFSQAAVKCSNKVTVY